MDTIFFHDGKLLGVEWHLWKVVGWIGNLVFFSRFFFQWYATEKKKEVVVPAMFWWLSLVGSMMLLAYSMYKRDSVFIFANAFTWIPYIRNLMIQRKHEHSLVKCAGCGKMNPPQSRFCSACGFSLRAGDASKGS